MRYSPLLLIALIIGAVRISFAQEIQGKAYYTSMVKLDNPEISSEKMSDPKYKSLVDQLSKPFIDEFVLEFTENESVFTIIPKLDKPSPQEGGISISIRLMSDSEILYKNIPENLILTETDLYGKVFLVRDDFDKQAWEIHKESKIIGEYVCFKATYSPSAEENVTKEPDQIVAWFTPQIPIKNGPFKYQNLPGLIMEVQEGNKVIACTKVVLNPEEIIEIKRPKRGKKIESEAFETLQKERSKEMRQDFKMEKSRRN